MRLLRAGLSNSKELTETALHVEQVSHRDVDHVRAVSGQESTEGKEERHRGCA